MKNKTTADGEKETDEEKDDEEDEEKDEEDEEKDEKDEEVKDKKETAVDEANRKDVCQTAFVRRPRIERPRSLWNICHPSRSNGTAAE